MNNLFTTAILTVIAALSLPAQTKIQTPSAPDSIPAARMETISREMLAQQSAVANLQAAQLEVAKFMAAPQASYNDSTARWTKLLDTLRKEFHAEGCDLTVEKTWDCTKRDKDKADAEALAKAKESAGSPKL